MSHLCAREVLDFFIFLFYFGQRLFWPIFLWNEQLLELHDISRQNNLLKCGSKPNPKKGGAFWKRPTCSINVRHTTKCNVPLSLLAFLASYFSFCFCKTTHLCQNVSAAYQLLLFQSFIKKLFSLKEENQLASLINTLLCARVS